MATRNRRGAAAVVAVVVAGAGWAWTRPTGTGDFRHSPDGRFTAHASSVTRGTLRGRVRELELRVEEAATGRTVWAIRHRPVAPVPELGVRGRPNPIRWDDGSSAVTFPLGGGRTLTLPVR